jgi:hypothetical protein
MVSLPPAEILLGTLPTIENPAPETEAPEIFRVADPVFWIVKSWFEEDPT